MNFLAIDYGTKRIGLAYSQDGLISTLPPIANDQLVLKKISDLIKLYSISKIYIGLPEWGIRQNVLDFVSRLSPVLQLPVETVEEAVSTIEAESVFQAIKKKKKSYRQTIDSLAAAVILRRVIG